MLRSLAIQITQEQMKEIKMRIVILETNLKEYLLSLIKKDIEDSKKERE